MKRIGYIFNEVCNFQSLYKASKKAAKGKKKSPAVSRFYLNLEHELIKLERELRTRRYRPLPYHTFTVTDPKTRRISAADFRDRVVHHSLCNVLEPILDGSLISDTYACRKNKGNHAAIRKAQRFSRIFSFFFQLDVAEFFDSVDHDVMKNLIRKKIKDPDVLWLTDLFIDHPVPWCEPGKGMPIGNLTSQLFANSHILTLTDNNCEMFDEKTTIEQKKSSKQSPLA